MSKTENVTMGTSGSKIIACCGHELEGMDDGVEMEVDGMWGLYCKECAREYTQQKNAEFREFAEEEEAYRMAEAHCEYTLGVYRKAYMDAFLHGYKHGVEDERK